MQKSSLDKINLSRLQTDLQLNYNGHFIITPPQSAIASKTYIENNKHRNWNQKQLQKFAAFIHFHHQKMITINTRKVNKVFKVLSQYIQTRNVNQCRIFATKMMRKFMNIERLCMFLRESLPEYAQICERQRQILKKIMNHPPETAEEALFSQIGEANQIKETMSEWSNDEIGKKDEWLKPTDTEYPMEMSALPPNNSPNRQEKTLPARNEGKINRNGGFFRSNPYNIAPHPRLPFANQQGTTVNLHGDVIPPTQLQP